jgi:hypothetical protein
MVAIAVVVAGPARADVSADGRWECSQNLRGMVCKYREPCDLQPRSPCTKYFQDVGQMLSEVDLFHDPAKIKRKEAGVKRGAVKLAMVKSGCWKPGFAVALAYMIQPERYQKCPMGGACVTYAPDLNAEPSEEVQAAFDKCNTKVTRQKVTVRECNGIKMQYFFSTQEMRYAVVNGKRTEVEVGPEIDDSLIYDCK